MQEYICMNISDSKVNWFSPIDNRKKEMPAFSYLSLNFLIYWACGSAFLLKGNSELGTDLGCMGKLAKSMPRGHTV